MQKSLFLLLILCFIFGDLKAQNFDLPQNITLEKTEDYISTEQLVLDAIDWLSATPINVKPEQRRAVNEFLIKWSSGNPSLSIELNKGIVTFIDCSDCLIMFIAGWAQFSLKNDYSKDKYQGSLAGIEKVISLYTNNKTALGEIQAVNEYIALKKNNNLENYVRKNTLSVLQKYDTVNGYSMKVDSLMVDTNYQEAFDLMNFAIYNMPDSLELYDMRGVYYELFQMFDLALEDFTVGVHRAEDPIQKAHFLSNRGGTKFKTRDFNGSYDDLIRAKELDTISIDILNNLAAVSDEVGKPDETLTYLYKIIEIDSNYTAAYVNLGFKYQLLGDHKKAIAYLDKAVALDPEDGLGYSNRSFSKLKSNDLEGAMEDISMAIKLYPTNSYAYKVRALILIEEGKLSKACSELQEAIKLGYTSQFGNEVDDLIKEHCK